MYVHTHTLVVYIEKVFPAYKIFCWIERMTWIHVIRSFFFWKMIMPLWEYSLHKFVHEYEADEGREREETSLLVFFLFHKIRLWTETLLSLLLSMLQICMHDASDELLSLWKSFVFHYFLVVWEKKNSFIVIPSKFNKRFHLQASFSQF